MTTAKYKNRYEIPTNGSDTVPGHTGDTRRDKACLVSTGKYKNRYRIASARATWWSYGWAGAYFITICTADRKDYFGHIVNNAMVLTPVGEFTRQFWFEIPTHAHHVELGAFVVMPNHVHGILVLQGGCGDGLGTTGSESNPIPAPERNPGHGAGTGLDMRTVAGTDLDLNTDPKTGTVLNMGLERDTERGTERGTGFIPGRDKACLVSTMITPMITPMTPPPPLPHSRFRNPGKNTVSSIIGGYKSAVSRHARRAGFTFAWQSRFHDHIIRNDEEYQRINDYIESNPIRWKDDRFFMSG